MKKIILLLLICVCVVQTQTHYMKVSLKGGGDSLFPIQDIRKIVFDGITSVENDKWLNVIKTFTLFQNYPNPFNPNTSIQYELPKSGNVNIKIFNMNGQLIKVLSSAYQHQGIYNVEWNGKNENGLTVASGLYIYQVSFDDLILSNKMLFIK